MAKNQSKADESKAQTQATKQATVSDGNATKIAIIVVAGLSKSDGSVTATRIKGQS